MKYRIHLNHVYETDQYVEVEEDNLSDAMKIAEEQSDIAEMHANASHTYTGVLDFEKIEEEEFDPDHLDNSAQTLRRLV